MKTLVLGGGGFIGSHLCHALVRDGHAVRIFGRTDSRRLPALEAEPQVEWLEGDFLNQDDLARAVEDSELVYHLISTTLPRSSNQNPVYDVETNLGGTLRLLDIACKFKVRKVVFCSSGGTVYGTPRNTPISEEHPTEPTSSYGVCKLAIEKYLHIYRVLHGLEYAVLRMSNPFGERQRVTAEQGAVAVFLYKALRGEPIEIWGDGSVVRDFFHVSDAASALVKAAGHTGRDRVFNIGAGEGRSLNDVLGAIESLLGRPVARTYLPGRAFDVPVNVLDISLARASLGWTPVTSFAEGLARTVAWMRGGSPGPEKG